MQFELSALMAVLAATAIASPVPTADKSMCASKVVSTLNSLTKDVTAGTEKNQNRQGPFATKFLFQAIVSGGRATFRLFPTLTKAIATAGETGCQNLSEEDQKRVCAAAQMKLVKELGGKKCLLRSHRLATLISAVLRTEEGAVDIYLLGIVPNTPVCGDNLESTVKNLQEI
ncbi:hypothetical protein N7532_012071 [Penicillium argentinense]|uniref:Uncharacterized protein n=1 Tax=Penicillium argentinense TaxID=1131581 RepID=A0A9W9EJK5_9EURO|nr:uncharacterized protein N7532_012071 [Penicillium argentinense]KAJ5083028.1 hypothetical protein N7532_012071 [Penicillium argentinense]